MKTLKSLFMLCAGLSFCACSSDNEPQFPEGEGMVEVKIVSPSTRADGDKINIKGDITITLTHANGVLSQTVNVGEGTAARTQTVKFWNVVSPSKVTASINGGKNTYADVQISTLQMEPNVIPAYGEVSTFGKDGTITATDQDNISGNGYKTGDTDKSFTKYTANVVMAIPVARLEVGAIGHVDHATTEPVTTCAFKTVTLTGVYLDDVHEPGGAYSPSAFAAPTANAVNYDGYSTAILNKASNAASAFNFYGEGTMPTFKVYFEKAVLAEGAESTDEDREGWAMITTYKDSEGTPLSKFENGKIYQIADVTLLDKNIVGDEENSALYAVEVTVTEAVWTVETTSAEWAE